MAFNALCERLRRTDDDDFLRAGTDIGFFMSAGSVSREENSVNEAFCNNYARKICATTSSKSPKK